MADEIGPLRDAARLERAQGTIAALAQTLGDRPFGNPKAFDLVRLEWFDLRNMLLVARVVAEAASARTESRGAHQREDFPGMLPEWRVNQTAALHDDRLTWSRTPVPAEMAAQ
jgi:succinate dehydrogenase / fumarate reductase flavoprotein subunit